MFMKFCSFSNSIHVGDPFQYLHCYRIFEIICSYFFFVVVATNFNQFVSECLQDVPWHN